MEDNDPKKQTASPEDTTEVRLYITPHQNGVDTLKPCIRGAVLYPEEDSAMMLRFETDSEKSFDEQWNSFCKTLCDVLSSEHSPIKKMVSDNFGKNVAASIIT